MDKYIFRHTSSYIFPICPEHKEVSVCECGMNTTCYSCGNGHGSSPCQCVSKIEYTTVLPGNIRSNVIDSLERSLDENADVWEKLANG